MEGDYRMSDLPEIQAKFTVFNSLLQSIWRGRNPYDGFPVALYENDIQGWGSKHPYLTESVEIIRPRVIVEIGVWKGGSTLTLASALRRLEIDGCVISIDTWLGSWDHWINPKWFESLHFEHGQPRIMMKFMQNVINSDMKEYIVPLPLDSSNAYHVLKRNNIGPDLIHIDGGHDYRAVTNDLEMWWPLLRPGGILIGDDYAPEGGWVEVRRAFDDFFTRRELVPIENIHNKCRIFKPKSAEAPVGRD
jgi:hypothetical protein